MKSPKGFSLTGGYTPIEVTGFNADVIANGSGTAAETTTAKVDADGYVLVATGYYQGNDSRPRLPLNRVLHNGTHGSGVSPSEVKYLLNSYTENNAINLPGGSGTFTFVTPNYYEALYLTGLTGNGPTTLSIDVVYEDNSTQSFTKTLNDWWGGSTYVAMFNGRVNRSTNSYDATIDNPRFRQIDLTGLSNNKKVKQINISNSGGNSSSKIANIFAVSGKFTIPPACPAPSNALITNNTTGTSVTLSWTAPATPPANGYDWEVRTSGAGGSGATGLAKSGSVANTLTSVNVTDLTPNTTYTAYVRAKCSGSQNSDWIASASFMTPCSYTTVPYYQNFNSVTPPAIPVCTSIENAGSGNNWVTADNPGYGFDSKVLKYSYNASNAANAWFYTQGIMLEAGKTYKIEYEYGKNSTSYTEKLKVAYGMSPTHTFMTTTLGDHTFSLAGKSSASKTFSPTSNGVYYFGFNAYSAADQWYMYVDNISIIELLPCAGAPASANIISDKNGFCLPMDINLSLDTDYSNIAGITYQWQSSANGVNYSNISSATSSTYSVNISTPTYFRCEIGCTAPTGGTTNSNIIAIGVGPNLSNEEICLGEELTITPVSNIGSQSANYLWYHDIACTQLFNGNLSVITHYENDFSTIDLKGATQYNDASVTNGRMQLVPDVASKKGGFTIPASGHKAYAYRVEFDLFTNMDGQTGADGLSYSFADDANGDYSSSDYDAEFGSGSKLKLGFDTYGTDFNNDNIKGIRLIYGPTSSNPRQTVGSNGVIGWWGSTSWANKTAKVVIEINGLGQLSLTVDNNLIFNKIQLPESFVTADKSNWKHVFKARTGGTYMIHAIDNLKIEETLINNIPSYTDNFLENTTFYVKETDILGCQSAAVPVAITVTKPEVSGLAANSYVWTGATNTNWNDTTNTNWVVYSGTAFSIPTNAPSAGSNVFIRKTASCFTGIPVVGTVSQAKCNNLTIDADNSLNLTAGGELVINGNLNNNGVLNVASGTGSDIKIKGNWTNNGTFSAGSGTVTFNGSSIQTIASGGSAFNNVVFNNGAGFSLSAATTINGAATFTSGIVNYGPSGALTFSASSSSNDGTATSYVNGLVTKQGNSAFIFPVGVGTVWAPIGIAAPSSASNITAKYFFAQPDSSYHNWSIGYMCPGAERLHHSSGVEYWELTSSTNGVYPAVTLYWKDGTISDIGNLTDLRVAHWNGSCWENKGGTGSGSISVGSITSTVPFTSYSPVTFGTSTKNNPLPVELINFTASCNQGIVNLEWATASETNNDYFVVERSENALTWDKIVYVKGAGNSSSINNYAYIDETAKTNTDYYYRLLQVDFDGKSKYFNIIHSNCDSYFSNPVINVYPNPFRDVFTLQIENWNLNDLEFEVCDMLGQKLLVRKFDNVSSYFSVELNLHDLAPAMYVLKIKTKTGVEIRKIEKR